jgi:cysteine-rich repeat protein
MGSVALRPRLLASLLLAGASILPIHAHAGSVQGTVTFQGNVVFDQPIAGIALDDLTASSGPGIEPTGNGEQCEIITNGSAPVGVGGAYPDAGTLSVTLEISKGGGPQIPDGGCIVQLNAAGNDGASTSARGTITVEVTVADISGNANIVVADNIVVRQSKTIAGLSKDCLKWVKKEIKFKGKCNYSLWKLGGAEGSLKCKNAGPEPADCDPAAYVDEIVALSFGDMDQQTDPINADAINLDLLSDQSKCQRLIGKAGANYAARRNQLVQKTCVDALDDDDACRQQATQDSKAKLDVLDNCVTDVEVDVMTGLSIADVDEPCRAQCITAGVLNRKCLKDCLQLEVGAFSDNLVGDVPLCGNGVTQAGEACDDGNVVSGDCCSSVCGHEAGSPEVGNCGDGLDNDCDGLTDAADVVDCP